MLFGTPISWLITEVFAFVIFFMAVNHATKQDNAFIKILELFGFMLGAALFENVGALEAKTYYYDLTRIFMVGAVPLEILMLEAAIWYAALNLALTLRIPLLLIPLVVGLFGSVQDMTIDPAAVFDLHPLAADVAAAVNQTHPGALTDGTMAGQWNWTYPGYDESFFGIPFYNFSGWMYLMAFYTAWTLLFRWVYAKTGLRLVGYLYPFVAGFLNMVSLGTPLNRVLLFGNLDPSLSTAASEITMLVLNFAVAIAILVMFRKRAGQIDMKEDGLIIFGLPIILHLYDIGYAVVMGTTVAYVPVLLVSAIHGAYLYAVWHQIRPNAPAN